MKPQRYYFSTRDLLMMAALAALGGVTSTYVSAAGRLVQSFLGIPGAMQWAAGLHVLWLTLAVGLTGKQGAGTVTGLLKGAVELLTGNPHGLLVVLVDVIAGILVDVGFLPFRDKERLPGYALAGGLSAASNVFVFQLFAALPINVLSYGAMLLVGGVAALSGVVFAGFLAHTLLGTLQRAGVVKDRAPQPMGRRAYPIFLTSAVLLTVLLTIYIRSATGGATVITIDGAVAASYAYPTEHSALPTRTADSEQRGVMSTYAGIPLRDLVEKAQPESNEGLLLITATDGYAFFISMEEVQNNPALLLAPKGQGKDAAYDIVGAENSKAWVRDISTLTVIAAQGLDITGKVEAPAPYQPTDWQFEMDSFQVKLTGGPRKLQGVPLRAVLEAMNVLDAASVVHLHTSTPTEALVLADVMASDDVRLFTVIDQTLTFTVAREDGSVIAENVTRIEVE